MTREELIQIDELKRTNPDFKHLFEKTEQEYQFTLSHIFHHIRNDLTMLICPFQLIEHLHPEVRSFKYWNECKSSISYTSDFLEQLSDYNNCWNIHAKAFNLEHMLKEFISSAQDEYNSSPVSISLDIYDSCQNIDGDADKLYQVLEQLLQNSREAVSDNEGEIKFTLSQSGSFCKIAVSDNGRGFSKEMREKMFTPFSSDKKHHAGLGLCTANRIVLAHKGYIRLAHTDFTGTCIEVCLPAASENKHLVQQAN